MGTSGSGKSTLAEELSKKFKIQVWNLDDICWEVKYTKKRDQKKRMAMVKDVANKKKWIIEGVSTSFTESALKKADLLILLDINIKIASYRIIKRWIKTFGKRNSLKDSLKLIKEVYKYKTGDHSVSYKSHKSLIKKHKINYVIIKNKKELKKFMIDYYKRGESDK